jgi:hypothetical protein
MKRILNSGIIWAAALLACLTAAAQTPSDTNAIAGQYSATPIQTNDQVNPNQEAWTMLTNQTGAGTNLNYLLGVTPSLPPLIGPGNVGNPYLQSPLAGNRIFNIPQGATGGAVPGETPIPVWGPITLRPSLYYGFTYATSVESQPGQKQSTIMQTVSPGFLFDIGTHWTLDYAPAYSIYSQNKTQQDQLSHALSLRGGTSYGDWSFSLAQSYYSSSDSLLETGTQTSQTGYDTAVSAACQLDSKTTLQLGFDQSIRDTTGFNNITTWSGNAGLNYAVLPQLRAGLSLGGGYNQVSLGSSMPFETVQGTLAFQPGQKLALFVSAGGEDMQFVNPSAPRLITPIFSGSVQYQLFPDTSISLSGSRSVNPSFFGNQVQVTTAVGASIRQILSQKWSLTLNAGYTTEPLTGIVPQALPQFFVGAAPRTFLVQDETLHSATIGMTLSYAIVKRVSLSAYCSVNDTTSSQSNFRYTSTQIGFTANYSY